MTKKIIALYDSNEDFICRLCSGFQQNCTLSLEFLPFTSLEKLLTFHSDHSISMLLTTEAMLTPQLISLKKISLIRKICPVFLSINHAVSFFRT